MQAFSKFNSGIKYLLAVIDVLSKYGYLIPLKDKTGKSVASALKIIFKERKPEKMWVDKGKEFYNKDVKELIELYSTENEEKSSVVERWIRLMKEKMWNILRITIRAFILIYYRILLRIITIRGILLLR